MTEVMGWDGSIYNLQLYEDIVKASKWQSTSFWGFYMDEFVVRDSLNIENFLLG